MVYLSCQMEKVLGELAEEFRAGKRWLVVEPMNRATLLSRVACFFSYLEAVECCQEARKLGKIYKVRVLGSYLKIRQRHTNICSTAAEMEVIGNGLRMFPIQPVGSWKTLESELVLGNYYPAYWIDRIEPLLSISEYAIVINRPTRHKKWLIYQSANTFPSICKALGEFVEKDHFDVTSAVVVGFYQKLITIGKELVFEENQPRIQLYKVDRMPGIGWQIFPGIDVTEPIERKISVFLRYRPGPQGVTFYDDRLRRINREIPREPIVDLSYFDADAETAR